MTTRELAWHTTLGQYISTVHTGGTPEQRAWAWARANDALDNYLTEKQHEDKARAKRVARAETVELPAVHPFPGHSI